MLLVAMHRIASQALFGQSDGLARGGIQEVEISESVTTATIRDEKGQKSEMLVQQIVKRKAVVSNRARCENEIAPIAADAEVIGALQQLEALAKRQCPRVAFKAKGRIFFLDLPAIVAVQAAGNYVSIQHNGNLYLLHESLSSIAEKLKPYGFIRIHRSVVVNASLVNEIEPLSSGEYRLRVKGGKEYLVTRSYKHNLRQLAHLWIGSPLWPTASERQP